MKKELRDIHKLSDLIIYLRDELEWPFSEKDTVDEVTFDYEPEELGIDINKVPKIKSIKKLRPFNRKQPFGIFWIEFENNNLPIVIMRRILQSLVKTNKGRSRSSDMASWNLHDLLFISSFGEKTNRELSFAHFREPEDRQSGDLPTLRVLGWDAQDTVLKLEHVEKILKEKLKWPDSTVTQEEWRDNWSKAFELRPNETIQTSERLAIRLADLARNIRNRAEKILQVENKNGVLKKLHIGFKEALIHDLTESDFADTYSQTIAYGLLAARVSRPMGIIADNVSDMVPITNPFLKNMLETFLKVGGRKGKLDFDELGIQEVVDLLNNPNTKMELILKDFGNKTRQEDPVIHFYELFLKEYDKVKKVERGVFYTPQPVVSFIVRSIHEVLQKEFGLEDGLASTITWKEFSQIQKIEIPSNVSPGSFFVTILDPATGTATFLVEVIDTIYKTMCNKWEREGKKKEIKKLWNEYIPKNLLPRLFGYELMMAPYSIAHMKIGLKLHETGYNFQSNERVRVYLTNALEPVMDMSEKFASFFPALAEEAESVNRVKTEVRFTVVLGNPPYLGEAGRGTNWIAELMRGKDITANKKTQNYFEVNGEPLGEANPKWLNDLYVKFIRFSEYTIEQTGVGILGFINNHSYIDNPTFRGMRESLLKSFTDIHIIDLHGNTKKKEKSLDGSKDENVFDIQQGTAIGIFVKKEHVSMTAPIYHKDLYGTRDYKYKELENQSIYTIVTASIHIKPSMYLFAETNEELYTEYEQFIKITEALPVNSVGIVTARDSLTIQDTPEKVKEVVWDFVKLPIEKAREKYNLGKDARDWQVKLAQEDLKKDGPNLKNITPILYRPFDLRYTYYTGKSRGFICMPRPEVMRNILNSNLSLICKRGFTEVLAQPGFISSFIIEFRCWSRPGMQGGDFVFPLYIYPLEDNIYQKESQPNFTQEFLSKFSNLKLSKKIPLELSIFRYIYSIFYSSIYRNRYSEFLKIDFPRIPIPKTKELFEELSVLGNDLIALHLLQEDSTELVDVSKSVASKLKQVNKQSVYFENGYIEKGYPKYQDERIYINSSEYFPNVKEDVWNFYIGGYQVLHKWLKDRKERNLNIEEILHYQKIIISIKETISLMKEIDAIIQKHGGFPNAFEKGTKKV